jgi:ABC-type uncharacterized transport system involved in gliding motility auxiliary subunit
LIAVAASLQTSFAVETRSSGLSSQARLVVVGNAQWLTNRFFNYKKPQNFNSDLMLNMVGWLAGLEKLLRIGSPYSEARNLKIFPPQKRMLFNITVILIPELMLLLGAFVWWIRR